MRIKNVVEEISSNNVREFYNSRAANYDGENLLTVTSLNDKNPAITEERNKAEKLKLLPKLKLDKDSCVLDLACGFERWLDSMPEIISKYRGIDFSDELIKLAKTRNNRKMRNSSRGQCLTRLSIALDERLTLKNFYSDELQSDYNAIYRTRAEMMNLFEKTLLPAGFSVTDEGFMFDASELNNRKETTQYYYILER